MRKNHLSQRELGLAVQNHECAVCGQGFERVFAQTYDIPVVLPGSRELVHRRCWVFPYGFKVTDAHIDYSKRYGLPTGHRAWSVLNRVKNALNAKDYTLDAIEDAADEFRRKQNE